MGPLVHSLAALTALLGAPLGAAALLLKPGWRPGLAQRLGRLPKLPPGVTWVHAASAGEALAARGLIAELARRKEGVFASATTLDGRRMLRASLPEERTALAPVDHPWCVASALTRVQPSLLALVETELWPVWLGELQRRRIPAAIVSGRLSERSYLRYQRAGIVMRPRLRGLAGVGARSDSEAARFAALGVPEARIEVTGDLKLGPPVAPAAPNQELARLLRDRRVIVAGSTHAGEERALEQALGHCERRGRSALLVVAPRYRERADAVARELTQTGRRVERRSQLTPATRLSEGDVLLLDTLGELAALYTLADVAFVGGSLVPVGGHNLMEPIHAGVPVLFGPHVAHTAELAARLEKSGAGQSVRDAESLAAALDRWLCDVAGARRAVDRAQADLAPETRSLERSLEFLERVRCRGACPAAMGMGGA